LNYRNKNRNLQKYHRLEENPMLQAIIFDMDGVIVDTEFLEYDLQAQFIDSIKEHNRTLTPLERSEVVGKGLAEIPEIVKKLSGSSFSLEEIKQRYFDFSNSFLPPWTTFPFFAATFIKSLILPNNTALNWRSPPPLTLSISKTS
jgi:Predicted phosphatase/phosphohexomutase